MSVSGEGACVRGPRVIQSRSACDGGPVRRGGTADACGPRRAWPREERGGERDVEWRADIEGCGQSSARAREGGRVHVHPSLSIHLVVGSNGSLSRSRQPFRRIWLLSGSSNHDWCSAALAAATSFCTAANSLKSILPLPSAQTPRGKARQKVSRRRSQIGRRSQVVRPPPPTHPCQRHSASLPPPCRPSRYPPWPAEISARPSRACPTYPCRSYQTLPEREASRRTSGAAHHIVSISWERRFHNY